MRPGCGAIDTEGNYYKTGQPTHEVIEKARENMHAKHPKTRFVNAHVAMLYYDMDKVAALLDKYPNADVEISAAVQDLGRAPLMIRKFFLKYQDRILFGSDGIPDAESKNSGFLIGGSWKPMTSTSITRPRLRSPPARRCMAAGESTVSACPTMCCARSTTPMRCAICLR